MYRVLKVEGATLVIEQPMPDVWGTIDFDKPIHVTIMGCVASTQWTNGLALIATVSIRYHPLDTVSIHINHSDGHANDTVPLYELDLKQLMAVNKIEMRYFVAPMCQVSTQEK